MAPKRESAKRESAKYEASFRYYGARVLDGIDETGGETVVKNFNYSPDKKVAGNFDMVVFNIYTVLEEYYSRKKIEGKSPWRLAYKHAIIIARNLAQVPAVDSRGQEIGPNVLDVLLSFSKLKRIAKIKLTGNFNIQFLGQNDEIIYEFNAIELRKNQIIDSSRAERSSWQENTADSLSGKTRSSVRSFSAKTWFLQETIGEGPLESAEDTTFFEPLRAPAISTARPGRTFSTLDAMRMGNNPPHVIEEQFRKLDLCSAYAMDLLLQEYGRGTLIQAGLIRHEKIVDAWDIKSAGLQKGGIEIKASTLDVLRQRRNGALRIKDKKLYDDKVAGFFVSADSGNYPSLITAFQTDTRYLSQIVQANRDKPVNERSYNSHVLVLLGRQPALTAEAAGSSKLYSFLYNRTGVKLKYQRFLKIRVNRSNGEKIEVSDQGAATVYAQDGTVKEIVDMSSVRLKKGDSVSWQDVLISDFYKGQERLIGLAWYASQNETILIENFTLKNAEKKPESPYRIVGFVQIEKGQPVSSQLQEKLILSDSDLQYYLAALSDSGINLNNITEKDIIPVFDIAAVRPIVDSKGGPSVLMHNILLENIDEYRHKNPLNVLIFVEPGSNPWSCFEPYFSEYFQGVYALTATERNFILMAIDESCPNIDFGMTPPKFEADSFIFLTKERIYEIALYVRRKQEEQFGPDDYIKIVTAGDDPRQFIKDCFDKETRKMGIKIKYENLDEMEISYLLKALQACSRDIDLNLVAKEGSLVWADFKEGDRMIFRKADLQKCIRQIQKKHLSQAPGKSNIVAVKRIKKIKKPVSEIQTAGVLVLPDFREESSEEEPSEKEVVYEPLKIPPHIKKAIDEIYPGHTLEEAMTRNALYFIWVNERARGSTRAKVKSVAGTFGLTNSIGEFQIRPTRRDMEDCREAFKKHGIAMPVSYDDFEDLVEDDLRVSVIVAGQRIINTHSSFRNFSRAGTEVDPLDENYMIMLLTSYNRSPGAVYRAVFQNWAYNFAQLAGVPSSVALSEIDALTRTRESRFQLENNVKQTFRRVTLTLIKRGEISFNGNIDAELDRIFDDSSAFVGRSAPLRQGSPSPLFTELARWHKQKTGSYPNFVFTRNELERGDNIFSYGRRVLEKPGQLRAFFADYDGVKASRAEIREEYTPVPFTPIHENIPSPEESLAKARREWSEQLLTSGSIAECYEGGDRMLTVYARKISLRDSPEGDKKANVYFGSCVKVTDVLPQGGELWMKVKVIEGEKAGEKGYMVFEKDWYSNNEGFVLTRALKDRLVVAEKDGEHPLPSDYSATLTRYLRFIDNFNPRETLRSAKLMERSQPTAFEVQDPEAVRKILAIAAYYGYDRSQRFFGILPKIGGANLRGQRYYLIDTANDRVLSFKVSTGKIGRETPAGRYASKGSGFRDLNSFGSHQGTFIQKYRGHRVQNFSGGREYTPGGKLVRASMTTGLIPIQRQGEMVRSAGLYFHGTNSENLLGGKASYGCIRMSNIDLVYLAGLTNGEKYNFQIVETKGDMQIALDSGSQMIVARREKGPKRRKGSVT